MPRPAAIDVTRFIDEAPLSPFQILIVVLCFLVVAIDGFDTAAIGFIAPAIRSEWQLSPAQLGPLFGAGLAGLMGGAFLFGPLSDRYGRKTVLVFSVLFFGVASLVSAWSNSLWELIALRFITGLGLGGAMPNAITLTSEYCPDKRRSFLVTTMFCGFTIGSALGGLASAGLIESYGWRSVLVVGGVLPLLLVPVLLVLLPESVRYLVTVGKKLDRVAATLQRIDRNADLRDAGFMVPPRAQAGSPVWHLFRPDLLRGTLLLWFAFFMSLLVIYLLSSWLPTVLRGTGISLKHAALVTAMFQVGGTVGAIVLGWLMDRLNAHYVLAASYTLAGVFTALIGNVTASPVLAAVAVFWAGFCVSGSQVGANALSAAYYPTDCRATGVSWANGVGRIGSVVGSVGGGAMLSLGLGMPALFVLVGIPAVLAGLTMLVLGRGHPGGRAAIPAVQG
ncbi:aromatic acid/H+ symport family MFS transporter [Cupriavidus cauae]|uniref:Aromatic acid/H+ symport family MFS transporter n=1 Tax=Cupriavidus cauae TaxID=2608999 RepID=A0A5M8ADV6_9BURK|nr:aromatic acid/H+ symport family MFS transporter [Cupriavidus cauae]KAA0182714.1 aromatic acid/H+ symport family MFS transporter [Cupriavidus gilardii]KAA6120872.1 aromatic acid/H+ symport family MFS transporter [Cupriavidus cauae]UZN51302.1 aromatic acid/H+ symport family MFS transporter [Cupriavidus cauae]